MTKKEYWEAHVKKNPKLADETRRIEMSVEMLHKLMDEAYDRGTDYGFKLNGRLSDLFGKVGDVAGIDLNKFKKEVGK